MSFIFNKDSTIYFYEDRVNGLEVTIDGNDLILQSIEDKEDDFNNFFSLYNDEEVMKNYSRHTLEKDRVRGIFQNCIEMQKEKTGFGAFQVLKSDTREFLGLTILTAPNSFHEAELSYLFKKSAWHKGFGGRAASLIVKEYLPAATSEGYLKQDGKSLKTLSASVRVDNIYSKRILEKIGMKKVATDPDDYFTELFSLHLV